MAVGYLGGDLERPVGLDPHLQETLGWFRMIRSAKSCNAPYVVPVNKYRAYRMLLFE